MNYTHAGGIVFKEEKGEKLFLIVTSLKNSTEWVLPKGHIEKNEKPEFTAIREVLEETGLLAKPVKEAGQLKFKNKEENINVIYFLMEFVESFGTPTENRKIEWLTKNEVIEKLSFNDAKEVITKL